MINPYYITIFRIREDLLIHLDACTTNKFESLCGGVMPHDFQNYPSITYYSMINHVCNSNEGDCRYSDIKKIFIKDSNFCFVCLNDPGAIFHRHIFILKDYIKSFKVNVI